MKKSLLAGCFLASFLAILSGCASPKLVVNNPNRDIYIDVRANDQPVAIGLSQGYADQGLAADRNDRVKVEAITYSWKAGVMHLIDTFRAIFALGHHSDVQIKVGPRGQIDALAQDKDR